MNTEQSRSLMDQRWTVRKTDGDVKDVIVDKTRGLTGDATDSQTDANTTKDPFFLKKTKLLLKK